MSYMESETVLTYVCIINMKDMRKAHFFCTEKPHELNMLFYHLFVSIPIVLLSLFQF